MAAPRLVLAGLLLLAPRAAGLRSRAPVPGDLDANTVAVRSGDRARSASSLKRELAEKLRPLLPEAMYKDPNEVRARSFSGPKPPLPSYAANVADCRMTSEGGASSCPLSSLPKQSINKVFPGGRTRCIFGTEFFFEVIPGDSDKLLLTMQGGGACWDEFTTVTVPCCFPDPYDSYFLGPRNLCPGSTPFENHTTVLVSHCSGDLHAGNASRPWPNPSDPSVPIEHHGYDNMRSVIDWIKANMDAKLSHFALHGESAGGIGAQVWSSTLLTEFKYDRANVLVDSYAGVFPEHFQARVFQDLGVCEAVLATGEWHERCLDGSITIPDLFEGTMKAFPDVTFGSINSKHDAIQTVFYQIAASSLRIREVEEWCGTADPDECDLTAVPEKWLGPPERIDSTQFHRRMEAIVERYSKLPNYVSYVMSSYSHVPTLFAFGSCSGIDYTAPCPGVTQWLDGGDGIQRLKMQNWTRRFFEPSRDKSSGCERLQREDEDDWCEDKQQLKTLG